MNSTDDLKQLIRSRGIRQQERRRLLSALEQDPEGSDGNAIRGWLDQALQDVRSSAQRLRKGVE